MHVGIAYLHWSRKHSRHSQGMRNLQFYVSDKRLLLTHIVRPSYLYNEKYHARKNLYIETAIKVLYMATTSTCPVIITIAVFTPRNCINSPNFIAPLLKQHTVESLLIVQDYTKMLDVKSKPLCWHITPVAMTSDAKGTEQGCKVTLWYLQHDRVKIRAPRFLYTVKSLI